MTGEDWTNYITVPAPRTLLCQFRRKDRYFNHVGFAKDFLPEFNVAGLEWKLTGIAKEQLDRMPEEVRRQVMSEVNGWANSLIAQSGQGLSSQIGSGWPGRIFDGLLGKQW